MIWLERRNATDEPHLYLLSRQGTFSTRCNTLLLNFLRAREPQQDILLWLGPLCSPSL